MTKGPWRIFLSEPIASCQEELGRLISDGTGDSWVPVKKTFGRRSIWKVKLDSDSINLFAKHYSKPRFSKQLKHLIRNSRTRQEWEVGLKLEEMGFPVPRHLAMAERKRFGLLQEDYIFQESLEGYENFDVWWSTNFSSRDEDNQGPDEGRQQRSRRKREVIARVASLVRRMHDKGVMQRDFKADSIMVGPSGEFKLVDLERVVIKQGKSGLVLADRLKNLAKIDQAFAPLGTVTDKIRFLIEYFKKDGLPGSRLSDYARTISRLSEMEFRKQARNRQAWITSSNESYRVWHYRGFRIHSYQMSISSFLKHVVNCINDESSPVAGDTYKDPRMAYNLRWCMAKSAFSLSPQLRYRRVPHAMPEAALLSGGNKDWGVLVGPAARPPYFPVSESPEKLAEVTRKNEFYWNLGRFLRVLHRMGITWKSHPGDFLLCCPEGDTLGNRFMVNRLELLVMDRTPSSSESRAILEDIADLLKMEVEPRKAFHQGYRRCMIRHFNRVTYMRLLRSDEMPDL